MTKKLTLKVQTLRVLESAGMASVIGGAKKQQQQPQPDDNGKAAFMDMWRQIAEQQSGSYR